MVCPETDLTLTETFDDVYNLDSDLYIYISHMCCNKLLINEVLITGLQLSVLFYFLFFSSGAVFC